jgi:galactonate dehydratase
MQARRKKLSRILTQYAEVTQTALGKHAIADLEVFPLCEPVSRRAYTLVRIRTQSGQIGYGECEAVSRRDVDSFRQLLVGRAATAYMGATIGSAMDAAVCCAMLDLVGQACSAPLYRVLGGPTRRKVRVMTTLQGSTDAELAASLSSRLRAGYRAFAVPIPAPASRNHGQAYVKQVRARLEALRSFAGDGVDFVVDAAGKLSPGEAAGFAAELEESRPLWLDEPCATRNLERIRRIAEQTVTPLGFGRNFPNPSAFQDFLRMGVMGIARPDVLRDGILSIRRIAALAETYYVAMAPRHEGGPVATAAAIHLAASLPNFFIQHIPFPSAEADRGMRSELLSRPVEEMKEGFGALPDGPGLGIAVNERALAKYKDSEL